MSESSFPEPSSFQWNSPILIAAVFLLVFVMGGATFMILAPEQKVNKREISETGVIVAPIGSPINRDKAIEKLNNSLLTPTDEFLTFNYLRTTHSGGLVQYTELPTEGIDDSEPALILELTKGEAVDVIAFPFTKGELATLEVYSVGPNGTGPISYRDLTPNDGISITRISDLMTASSLPDQIIIEATKQDWQD